MSGMKVWNVGMWRYVRPGHTCILGMWKVDSVSTLPPTYRVCQQEKFDKKWNLGMKLKLTT